MDFLHGDVSDDELEAACFYEYSRESDILCALASINKAVDREISERQPPEAEQWEERGLPHPVGGPGSGSAEYLAITERFEFDPPLWFMEPQWRYIWDCPFFPEKGWMELGDFERTLMLSAFSTQKIKPLATHDVAFIESMGVPRRFQALAKLARQRAKKRDLKKIPPIVQGWPANRRTKNAAWASVLFTIDFTKKKSHLLKQFHAWLESPDVQEHRKRHEKKAKTGLTGIFTDRLKDLGSWRIYRTLGGKAGLKFAEDNRKHDSNGKPRAFHDPRPGQIKVIINAAPLYRDEPAFCVATKRARDYLADIIPHWKPIPELANFDHVRHGKVTKAQRARAVVWTRTDRIQRKRKPKK